MKTVYRYSRNA